ncbi:MAG: formate dehydrogenase accessory sulfurtransferase FdhD [Tenacibaculum sp.]
MKQAKAYQVIKIASQSHVNLQDNLVIEAPLQININEHPYTVVMRTPGDDNELVLGLLYAEDIYRKKEPVYINKTHKYNYNTVLTIKIPKKNLGKGYANKRTLLSISSCGICGKTKMNDLQISGKAFKTNFKVSPTKIQYMLKKMTLQQKTFQTTGGSHACSIFNASANLLVVKEDIGRHNAVDKCIGHLLLKQQLLNAKIMLVSGRVSYEIVSKAFFAKIPLIIAVSACSSLAVDFAKEFGICLIGFCRNDKLTIYSNPQYISQ